MSIRTQNASQPQELSVAQARDHFSDRVNRAAFGGEVTYVTRGHKHEPAAAIVPMSLIEEYEELMDARDARIADERLEAVRAGHEELIPATQVAEELGL
ncbi:hypothetical protein GCM10027570_54940 [Streptomonospora sediminis]